MHMVIIGIILSVIPLSFVASVAWVVMQLPARMRRGDTAFLHAFAFLFFRFNLRAYRYYLVLLLRNLATALAPLVSNEAMQLFFMMVALGLPTIICAASLPWRIVTANVMDLATNTGIVLILFLAALLSQSASERRVVQILTAVFCVLCFLFLVGVLKSLHGILLLWSKTYQYFLCHHKHGGGGFSRLLKMRLKRDHRVKREVFRDSDNLQDLSLLFGFVANVTDTVVVLCTSSILLRPWCVGDLITAKLLGVDTVLLLFR